MKLGFVTAIFPDLSLEEVVEFAADEGYDSIEVMCWPRGAAERRYAGVSHLDVDSLKKSEVERIRKLLRDAGVSISALGYYPNALSPDAAEARAAVRHIRKVIRASALLGIGRMNTFVGRDWRKSVDDNWPRFLRTWKPIIRYAESQKVRVGIENCPMLFSADEWPGGKNLAMSPAIWRRMFRDIPSRCFGLNYDPSHLVWLQIDPIEPIWEFRSRIVHAHAKDARIDEAGLQDHGILGLPPQYHTPKIPGLGDVDWGQYFSVLTDIGYTGSVCVEVEDRAYEKTLASRKASLRQSLTFLRNYVPADG